jgi:hypothetical protein
VTDEHEATVARVMLTFNVKKPGGEKNFASGPRVRRKSAKLKGIRFVGDRGHRPDRARWGSGGEA